MLQHHLLLAFRNFLKFKNTFLINLIGLSTGLACTMLIYLWVADELSMDKFHSKDAQLYQLMEHQQYAADVMTTTSTPGLLADALKAEIPEIEYAATTTWVNKFTLTVNNNNITGEGFYVGEDFFNIFSFELIEGNPDYVLKDKNSIVISESLARSLFGTTDNLIGKSVEFQHNTSFLITGIFKEIPTNSSNQFDFVLSFEVFKDENPWVTHWGSNGPKTFAIVHKGTDIDELNKKIADFVKNKNEQSNVTLFLKSYSDQYLHGKYENGQLIGGRIEYVNLFSIIAVFILLIASINFMNLSTARAARRAKEVGIKKAVGAGRGSLITQYLSESMIMALASLILAVILVVLALPEFNHITTKEITLFWDPKMIGWFIGIALITGFISGSYPAFYLSGFLPAKVLKGELRSTAGELWIRRGLVVFQFTLSVILIVAVIVVYSQIQYVQSKNLGYNNENVIMFDKNGKVEENSETFLKELKKLPGIVNASGIGHSLLGRNNNTSGLVWDGKNPDDLILFENVRVDYDLLETLGVQLKQGRFFSREFGADSTKIIFNETAIEIMGLEDPIGKTVTLWSDHKLQIIGVVKDFHFQSLHSKVEPLFFRISDTWNIMARIEAGKVKETIAAIDKLHSDFNPGFELSYSFMDQEYAKLYASEQRVASLSRYFAGFAILISCLGLFGLAAFVAERRLKEIGIRKALGASVTNITYLLTSDFTRLVILSIIIALPLSYVFISQWLERFAFRIELSSWFFFSAGIAALLIAWLTVGSQAIRAARVNPTDCLKDE